MYPSGGVVLDLGTDIWAMVIGHRNKRETAIYIHILATLWNSRSPRSRRGLARQGPAPSKAASCGITATGKAEAR